MGAGAGNRVIKKYWCGESFPSDSVVKKLPVK